MLVDHDEERPIGFVRELAEMEDTDGEWIMALCTITDPPSAGWLRSAESRSRDDPRGEAGDQL